MKILRLKEIPLTWIIIAINIAIYTLQQTALFQPFLLHLSLWSIGRPDLLLVIEVSPYPSFEIWQLISYGFLHGSNLHLFSNMLALFMFGLPLERYWGRTRFSFYYFSCLIGAGFIQLLVTANSLPPVATLGASGAVFGLLFAYGMTWPRQKILLLIPPIPIEARWFVLIYGTIELIFGVVSPASKVAHFAHLGGMLFGALIFLYWHLKFKQIQR